MDLIRSTTIVFASDVIASILGVVGFLYFTRELGAALFGVYVLFQSVVKVSGIVVDFGIKGAVEKRISEGQSNVFSTGLVFRFVGLSVVSVVIVLFQPIINTYIRADLGLLLVPVLIFSQIGQYLRAAVRGEQKVERVGIGLVLKRIVFVTTGVALLLIGTQVKGLIFALLLSWAVHIFWLTLHLSVEVGRPTMNAATSLVDYAKYNFVSSIVGARTLDWLDTVVIGLFLGPAFVGAYEVAWRISGLTTQFSRSIAKNMFPRISNWSANDNQEKISSMLSDALVGTVLFVIPASVGVAILGREFLVIVFGVEYKIAAMALVILMVGRIFQSVNDIIARVILGIDSPEITALVAVLIILINGVLNVVLVQYYGISGAAFATSLSFIAMVLLQLAYVNSQIPVRFDWREGGTIAAAAAGMGVVVATISIVVRPDTISKLLTLIGVGIVTYFAFLILSDDFRRKFTRIIDSVVSLPGA